MSNDDLISRKALCETVERYKDKKYNAPIIESLLASILCVIENAPAVDAEPVRRGKWERTDEWDEWYARVYKCSLCGGVALGSKDDYCLNCGAKMDV